MAAIKHIGRLRTNKRRLIVAYRTIPNDPESCLVIFTEALSSDEHDSLIKLVESAAGQQAYELAEAMSRSYLPDGRNMLAGFHQTGRLFKISTSEVEMTPDTRSSIMLNDLNVVIAQQQGVSLEDLALKPLGATAASNTSNTSTPNASTAAQTVLDGDNSAALAANIAEPLSDEQLATKYRSDADRLYKEAKRLRDMADDLAPIAKKANTKSRVET